jgi:hypothetical protein
MQGGMFNTICLPFDLNLNDIPAKHLLNGVEIKQFKGVKLEEIGGENILTLQFGDVDNNTMQANTPHIIKPVNNKIRCPKCYNPYDGDICFVCGYTNAADKKQNNG